MSNHGCRECARDAGVPVSSSAGLCPYHANAIEAEVRTEQAEVKRLRGALPALLYEAASEAVRRANRNLPGPKLTEKQAIDGAVKHTLAMIEAGAVDAYVACAALEGGE